jgi:hypothetical protein
MASYQHDLAEEAQRLSALSSLCTGIKKQSKDILDDLGNLDIAIARIKGDYNTEEKVEYLQGVLSDYESQANSVRNSYEHAKMEASKLGLDLPTIKGKGARPILREFIIACDAAIGFATRTSSPLTPEETDRLDHIRAESREVCKNLDFNFEKNIELATKHYERGDFLGSSLISSRVIAFVIGQIEGEEIDAKVAFLVNKGILKAGQGMPREAILRADRKARNILAHRIDTFADASDANSLLGDCLQVLKIYSDLRK